MSDLSDIYIIDAGMITPVGVTLDMTDASIRAGINQYQDSDYYDHNHNPIKMALVPDEALKAELENMISIAGLKAIEIRLIQLISEALNDIDLSLLEENKPVAVFIAGPSSMGLQFIEVISELTGLNIDFSNSRSISVGRAGGVYALDAAAQYIRNNAESTALVIGADSYNDLDIVNDYLSVNRLMTSSHSDGFVPGEAASVLVLSSVASTGNSLSLNTCGFGHENGSIVSDKPYLGDGLANAFTQALKAPTRNSISYIYSSMNGESYWSKELGVAILRNKSSWVENHQLYHPADCYGDIGAATGAVLIGLAVKKLGDLEPGNAHLIYCSSDSEHRAAVCIQN